MPNLIWSGKKDQDNSSRLKFKNGELLQNSTQNLGVLFEKYQHETIDNKPEKYWQNLLIWGENKDIINLILKDFSGKINLIYIDPPFATGGNFNYKIHIGENNFSESAKAYSDTWKEGLEAYLSFLYERLMLMKHLLSENGSIYVHLDWHVSHYVKIILDEIFGSENFRNEIIWSYPAASVQTRRFFIRSYDVILFYTKSNDYIFNDDPNIYMEYSNRVKNALKKDNHGIFYYRGGSHNGKKLSRKVYVKEEGGIFPRDVWNDIPYIRANTMEYQGFSTQKPERLLKRIILASSNERDLIADFFCGSGTSLIVAEKLNRRWIGCDLAKHAIHISRKRILDISNSNNLFNWKETYDHSFQPFKVINMNSDFTTINIPENFLKTEGLIINNNEPPSFVANICKNGKKVWIELKNYKVPYINLINDKIKANIVSFHDLIDYWAIDFNHKDNCFNNVWFSYKTHKNRKIELISTPYYYKESNKYNIQVKVINIFGQESSQKYLIKIN
ncbi:MAG: site-specific DNA-methyltransferase [Promethearchaeia archaeon]